MRLVLSAMALACAGSMSVAAPVPTQIVNQLPSGYSIMSSAKALVEGRTFYILALRSHKEASSGDYLMRGSDSAPKRPLIVYERRGSTYLAVGRNDDVIDRAGDAGFAGNGCDPFDERSIAVKNSYFTVENRVSCGAHWTDYITFRFDPRRGWIFDNARFQSWKLNPSKHPNAEALVPDVQQVKRGSKAAPVLFSDWRPN